nr:retrovirus-related Pol polyprotein from transposon TNT 1-94 [Tanacetum cinerariifolium]
MSGQGVITDKQVVTNHAAANASRWKKMVLSDTCDEVEKEDRGCGFHQRVKISIELLTALDRREKEARIFTEPLVDLFMKATTVKGVDNSLINIQITREFGWYPALAQYRLSLPAVSKGREMASFIEDLTWLLLGGAGLFSLIPDQLLPEKNKLNDYVALKGSPISLQAVEATGDSPAVPEHTTVETPMNMSSENKAHFLAEKEAIHLILTGIRDDIYSTVDACQTSQEMWEPEWSRFVTIVKQHHKLDEVSYHKLFDILKQYQNEVNELRAEKLPRNANPLALRDKDMQKNLALIVKYFKKIYKPTNNNLRTSSNSKNKNVDMTPWLKNDNQSGEFGIQRMVNIATARENVESKVVQQSGIQCFNCKEYGHFSKECRKPKRVKDSAYHKEKMLLCKQAEQGVLLEAEQYDWLADTDEEVDEQELEAHYSYMAKIQEVPTADSGTDSEPVEQVQNDAGYNVFANHLQHSEQSESVSNTCLVETDDSNVIPDSPDMCEDDIQNGQNDEESDDE